MKIALVVERFALQGGGAEKSSQQIARELIRRGHAVTMLAGRAYASEIAASDIPVRAFGKRRLGIAALLGGFSRWVGEQLDQGGFDTSISMTLMAPAAVVQPRSGVFREAAERSIARRRTDSTRALKRAMLAINPRHLALLSSEKRTIHNPRVQRFVAISHYMARQLREHYHVSPERIDVIPNAAVMPVLDATTRQAQRQRIRASLQLRDGQAAFLFPAMDPWRKGFEPLLLAMQKAANPDASRSGPVLLLVGQFGYAEFERVFRMGLRPSVRIIGLTRDMIGPYIAADVTVLPTFYDPASKVLVESMMMGTPVIGTAYDGSSDLVLPAEQPARGRVIADPWDVEALAKAITSLSNPTELTRCQQAIQGLAEQLSMRTHVDRLEAVLARTATK